MSECIGFIDMGMKELCDLLGITPTAIRNYERYHVISAQRKENGYRYFSFNDVQRCLRLKSFTSLGFSIAQATRLTREADFVQTLDALKIQEAEDRAKIAQIQRQMEYLAELQGFYREMERLDEQYEESIMPGMYWIQYQDDDHLIRSADLKSILQKWSNYLPFTESSPRLRKEGLSTRSRAEIGLCIRDRYSDILDFEDAQYAIHYCPQRCIRTVVHANFSYPDYYSVIEGGLRYIKDHGMELNGDIMTILIASDMYTPWRSETANEYYLCYYPVK